MTKAFLSFFLGCTLCSSVNSQEFESFFIDKTLRVDYLFTGDKKINMSYWTS